MLQFISLCNFTLKRGYYFLCKFSLYTVALVTYIFYEVKNPLAVADPGFPIGGGGAWTSDVGTFQ